MRTFFIGHYNINNVLCDLFIILEDCVIQHFCLVILTLQNFLRIRNVHKCCLNNKFKFHRLLINGKLTTYACVNSCQLLQTTSSLSNWSILRTNCPVTSAILKPKSLTCTADIHLDWREETWPSKQTSNLFANATRKCRSQSWPSG